MPISKPMSKDLRETNKRKGNMKLQLEKKGVPWGTDWKRGLRYSAFCPALSSPQAAGASGLRRWGDQRQRRCSEWYYQNKKTQHGKRVDIVL